jgi:hypothetical protein
MTLRKGSRNIRRIAGRSNVLRYPLRKIVGHNGPKEILECGHEQYPRQDFMGPTNAVRRRCAECFREKEQHIPVGEILDGRCFVRVVGTYTFLKLSRATLIELGLIKMGENKNVVYGVDYKGNVQKSDPEEPVAVMPHSMLIHNADWLYDGRHVKFKGKGKKT